MQDPKVILADEPIASLDPMNAQVVMDALRRIHEEDGRMVIANLHTLDTARRYCDRVIGMRDGRVVFDGTPAQLTTGVARDIYGADASFDRIRHIHLDHRPAGRGLCRCDAGLSPNPSQPGDDHEKDHRHSGCPPPAVSAPPMRRTSNSTSASWAVKTRGPHVVERMLPCRD